MNQRVDGRTLAGAKRLAGSYAYCLTCDRQFYRKRSQTKQGYGNYCSKTCWAATLKTRRQFQCVVCSGHFERAPWQIAKGYTRYCSRECIDRFKRKLSTHGGGRVNLFMNWQKREWLESACAVCGATHDLQLDHKIPRFAGGGTERENAQTLCRPCNRAKYWEQDFPYYSWLSSRAIFNRTSLNSL